MPPLPKDPTVRQRRNRTPGARTLQSVHDVEVPSLPGDREWRPETLAWWADIWASPMAPEFHDSDMRELHKLAVLEDDFWSCGSAKARRELAGEIRLQRQCFGLTPIDRRRLQWEIDRGEAAEVQTSKRRATRRPKSASADPRQLLAQ